MKEEIQRFFRGEVLDDESTLRTYSHDASLFEVMPKLVVYPKDSEDLKNLVQYVDKKKETNPEVSLTVRAAGSCMSGGPLNESIIADVTKHMSKMGEIQRSDLNSDSQGLTSVWVEPGMFYRDFEEKTLEHDLILPCFPASKDICALGGMIANNCAGEKTLRYGKMENYVVESRAVFADGNEYIVKPLTREELEEKISKGDYEGELYRKLFALIEENREIIGRARPKVSKNSAGYFLWNVCPSITLGARDFVFDLNKLLVGSQGTLGIITEAKISIVPVEPVSKLFVIFLHNLDKLAELINEILTTNPESVKSYDDSALKIAERYFPELVRKMKAKSLLRLLFSFIPEGWMILRGGFPKMVLLVEYSGKSEVDVDQKLDELEKKISHFGFNMRKTRSQEEASKYWTIRRESFSLLRQHVRGGRTAPFVDDVVVLPEHMPRFLPEM